MDGGGVGWMGRGCYLCVAKKCKVNLTRTGQK